jgi:hypothetical protein
MRPTVARNPYTGRTEAVLEVMSGRQPYSIKLVGYKSDADLDAFTVYPEPLTADDWRTLFSDVALALVALELHAYNRGDSDGQQMWSRLGEQAHAYGVAYVAAMAADVPAVPRVWPGLRKEMKEALMRALDDLGSPATPGQNGARPS